MRLPLLALPALAVTLLAQPATLNLSHDLTTNGIASANLQPNAPGSDARPLLEAALSYAASHGITQIVADPGAYYFLTVHNPNTHVLISGASNLTIDWQHSDLYFQFSNTSAIECLNCNKLTMQNFTVDYLQLPFTQVTVTTVDTSAKMLSFQTIPGYQSPSAFNTNRAPDGSDAIFMWVFRNGQPIVQTGRLSASRPVSGSAIAITDVNDPWASSANLAAIEPGDTLVFSDRSGPPAVNFVGGQNDTVHNASIYSSGQIGLYFGRTNAATADHVQVIPRPGTSRLISTNADGIHTSFALNAQTFTNNIVRRTCDDALAISAAWLATVTKTSGSSVTVSRSFSSPFPTGATIAFINPVTAAVAGTATIVSETPPDAQQLFTDAESVTLTLNASVAGLAANFGMVDTLPANLGSGSTIAYNTVQEGVFSRGIWLSGVTNVSVHDNYVQRTTSNGIFVQQLSANNSDTGPSSNLTIQNNIVESAINYGNVSHGVAFAAASIYAVSQNNNNAEVTTMPLSHITVSGNRVTNSARSGIRLENVNGGQISGNSVQGYGLAPAVNAFSAPSCCETLAQYESDFSQAILTPTSASVSNSGNTSAAGTGTLNVNASTASGFSRIAAGSFAAAYGTNLAATPATAVPPYPASLGGVTVAVTDSAGVTRSGPIYSVSSSQVNYIVPPDSAPGVATVTIGSSTGGAQIDAVAPGLYSANANGTGVAAATAALYSADGSSTPEPVFQCSASTGACVSAPLALGSGGQQLAVTLYGTGLRNLSSPQNVTVSIGGVAANVLYAGAQPQYPGLDQVNVIVPPSLAGAGEVPVVLTVDGQTANVVILNIQ